MDEHILHLTYNAGRGHMTLDLDHFLPCTKVVLRKIEKLILEDSEPEERVREIRRYIDQRNVYIDEMIEEGAYALGEKNIKALRRMQENLRITRGDLMEWATKKRLTS